jgi:hypothetical protein
MTSPSTESMVRCVNAIRFSMQDVDVVDELLHCPAMREKIMASSTPASLETSTRDARCLISSMFDISKGAWRGPLPKPRVSLPLTLRDCVVKDLQSCISDHRNKPSEKEAYFQISKVEQCQMLQSRGLMGLITRCLSTQVRAGHVSISAKQWVVSCLIGEPYLPSIANNLLRPQQQKHIAAIRTQRYSRLGSQPWRVEDLTEQVEGNAMVFMGTL